MCTKTRYFYRNGRLSESDKGLGIQKVTAPWDSFWFASLSDVPLQAEFVNLWDSELSEQSELRLAHSFLKRRGDPGYNTALDGEGRLIGRPDNRSAKPSTNEAKSQKKKGKDGKSLKRKKNGEKANKGDKAKKMCPFRQRRMYDDQRGADDE